MNYKTIPDQSEVSAHPAGCGQIGLTHNRLSTLNMTESVQLPFTKMVVF